MWMTTRNMPILRLSYNAKFGRSRSNHLGVNRENPLKNLGRWPQPLGMGHISDSLKTCPSRHYYDCKFGRCSQTICVELRRSSEKSFTLPILPFKVTGTDID